MSTLETSWCVFLSHVFLINFQSKPRKFIVLDHLPMFFLFWEISICLHCIELIKNTNQTPRFYDRKGNFPDQQQTISHGPSELQYCTFLMKIKHYCACGLFPYSWNMYVIFLYYLEKFFTLGNIPSGFSRSYKFKVKTCFNSPNVLDSRNKLSLSLSLSTIYDL